jgi:SAM-dependent methyltransferase
VNKEEEKVRDFYDSYGWVTKAAASGEDTLFRDFSPAYYPYHDRVNVRTLGCFADLNGRLLIAGGGDLPETHVMIAHKFPEITCLDISRVAIEIARGKLENRGEFVLGSILDIPRPAGHFDAVYCAHVIYHIDRDQPAKAVRELIRVTRPGGRIVIIYSNPDSLPDRLARFKGRLPYIWRLKRRNPTFKPEAQSPPPLYFFSHPLNWWAQFADQCDIEIRPWDVMGNAQEEAILVNDAIASFGYRFFSWFEINYPDKAARWWSYPLLVLTKSPYRPNG